MSFPFIPILCKNNVQVHFQKSELVRYFRYFEALLSSNWKEPEFPISLPEVDFITFYELLSLSKTLTLPKILGFSDLKNLLVASDLLDNPNIHAAVDDFLRKTVLNNVFLVKSSCI